MLQQVETIFEDMGPMLKVSKKKNYEENMKNFREKNNEFFFQLTDWLKGENKAAIAQKLSKHCLHFVQDVVRWNWLINNTYRRRTYV